MTQNAPTPQTPETGRQIFGTLLILSAALCWALSGTAAKHLFLMGISPTVLVQMRATVAGALIALWLLIKDPSLFKVEIRDLPRFFFLGLVGMAMLQYTYLFAISRIHVAVAILIQYLAPVFIFLWALLFGSKKPTVLTSLTICGTVLGCYFVSGAFEVELASLDFLGIAGGLGAAISFAYYSISAEGLVARYDSRTVTLYAFLFSTITWNAIETPLAFVGMCSDPSFLFWGLFVVIVGTVTPFSLYTLGMTRVSSVNASITATTEPIFAAAISWCFIGEALSPVQMAGAALVLISIGILNAKG